MLRVRPPVFTKICHEPSFFITFKKTAIKPLSPYRSWPKKEVVGVINVQHKRPKRYQPDEMALLSTIANHAAIAIEHAALVEKSVEMQEALAVRKLMERAKGYLMRSKKLTEEEAFKLIQRQSIDLRKSMREIAEAIRSAGEMKERVERQWCNRQGNCAILHYGDFGAGFPSSRRRSSMSFLKVSTSAFFLLISSLSCRRS